MANRLLKSVRMRCAFRYLICLLLVVLLLVSFQLSFFSARTLSLFYMTDSSTVKSKWKQTSELSVMTVKSYSMETETRSTPGNKIWADFRQKKRMKTGNPLIDNYGNNDKMLSGENGRGVTFVGEEKSKAKDLMDRFHLNVLASDIIPLNRMVPDARFKTCEKIPYPEELPSTSVIVPFHDEWFSVLLRTVYSIVNRTPWDVLQEIVLVDDGSTMEELKGQLTDYIDKHFPMGVVKLVRIKERVGLIKARLKGWQESTGEVVVFFDSHMEVNINWLPPLLTEIKNDRRTVAMGVLDYVQQDTFEYKYNEGYMTRYGFDWRLVFFETFFRPDQIGKQDSTPRIGTVMVGAAYAIDSQYFKELGAYDEGMKVWGGENLEMAWRVWLCGGRLLHVPCSHIGHVARSQPYSFPGGRAAIEEYNYKRAVEVWMEPQHKELVYSHFPNMKNASVGDISERLALKARLKCKPFSWFLKNIWPELFVYNENVTAWGSARNLHTNLCLDNHQYLFQAAEKLFADPCHYSLATQGFSMTTSGYLRTSLQCVILQSEEEGARPVLQDCIMFTGTSKWVHKQSSFIIHEKSGLCLDIDDKGPVMKKCSPTAVSQLWQFNTYL